VIPAGCMEMKLQHNVCTSYTKARAFCAGLDASVTQTLCVQLCPQKANESKADNLHCFIIQVRQHTAPRHQLSTGNHGTPPQLSHPLVLQQEGERPGPAAGKVAGHLLIRCACPAYAVLCFSLCVAQACACLLAALKAVFFHVSSHTFQAKPFTYTSPSPFS